MKWLFDTLIGAVTGVISGFGVGGGSLLVLYLTVFGKTSAYTAGGINLLYFLGCAPAALVGHIRQHTVIAKAVLWCSIGGIVTAIPAAIVASHLKVALLQRLFGILLLYIGIRELRAKPQKQDP